MVSEAVTTALKAFQHIDSLILNAGILDPLGRVDAPDIPLAAWKSHFDVNFFSLITALRATLLSLRGSDLGGRVVFVSSGSATKGTPSMGPYNASKAAMNSLCRYMLLSLSFSDLPDSMWQNIGRRRALCDLCGHASRDCRHSGMSFSRVSCQPLPICSLVTDADAAESRCKYLRGQGAQDVHRLA